MIHCPSAETVLQEVINEIDSLLAAQDAEMKGGATDPHAKNSALQLLLWGSKMAKQGVVQYVGGKLLVDLISL